MMAGTADGQAFTLVASLWTMTAAAAMVLGTMPAS
jgi:hypothetical protein